jgi:K+-transporting ATPase ATPase B chain
MSKQKKFVLMGPRAGETRRRRGLAKLDPRVQWRNPVMFVVYIGSILTTLLWLQSYQNPGKAPIRLYPGGRSLAVVHRVIRQLRRSMAEGRSKAQAASLRSLKKSSWAKKLRGTAPWHPMAARAGLRTCAATMWC